MFIVIDNSQATNRQARQTQSSRNGGWFLAESMVAIGVGLVFLVALIAIFVACSVNFAGVGNYINMDRHSRNALDHMTCNMRAAKQLSAFDQSDAVFKYDSAGSTNLAYRYNASSGIVTEEWTVAGATTTNTLLTACDAFQFSLYDRDLVPTTGVASGQGKVISIAWHCSGTALTRTNSEYMQQAQVVIRNQP